MLGFFHKKERGHASFQSGRIQLHVRALLEAGFRRVELAPTWLHVDVDADKPHDVAFYQTGGKY